MDGIRMWPNSFFFLMKSLTRSFEKVKSIGWLDLFFGWIKLDWTCFKLQSLAQQRIQNRKFASWGSFVFLDYGAESPDEVVPKPSYPRWCLSDDFCLMEGLDKTVQQIKNQDTTTFFCAQCLFVFDLSHQDPATDLRGCIPYRLYGDGAEAHRAMSKPFFQCPSYLDFFGFHWKLRKTKIWNAYHAVSMLPVLGNDGEPNLAPWQKVAHAVTLYVNIHENSTTHQWCQVRQNAVTLLVNTHGISTSAVLLVKLRLAVINATYCKAPARKKILEVIKWSCNALGYLAKVEDSSCIQPMFLLFG